MMVPMRNPSDHTMKLCVCLIAHVVFLSACAVHCGVLTQQLELWVWEPCPKTQEELEKSPVSRETFFHSGCTVQLLCMYRNDTDYAELESPSLTVFHRKAASLNIREVSRSRYSLLVELQNLTVHDEGHFVCNDTTNYHWRQRHLRIGYPPEEPRNLTMVFEPKREVTLLLDQVKTAVDLNDDFTEWFVSYTWRNNHSCSMNGQEVDREDGRFIACKLNLRGKYEQDGQYGEGLGSSYSPINFTVTVTNIFGSTKPISQRFFPHDYIKPNKLRGIKVMDQKSDSGIVLKVRFPGGIEKPLCENMSHTKATALKVEYLVTGISEEDQQAKGNKSFYNMYGFYRNLEADEAALGVAPNFSTITHFKRGTVLWSDRRCRRNTTLIEITDLPLPDTYYNITLRAGGRYWGAWQDVPGDAKTDEREPDEGPAFDNSFYLCFPDEPCVTCVVYFKEIPRPLRGGRLLHYTLDGNETSGAGKKASNCSNAAKFSDDAIDGQSNTVVVKNLLPEASYKLSLRAYNRKGSSPVSTAMLRTGTTHSTPAAPQHVVIEKHEETYDISWRAADVAEADRFLSKYYVHHCYAEELPCVTSQKWNKLRCKTNMVTEQVNSSTRIKSVTVPRYSGSANFVLTPTFFVSLETKNGSHSTLVKPECLYARDRAPQAVRPVVMPWANNPQALLVTFKHECDSIYLYGRPSKFCVVVAEQRDECSSYRSVQHGEEFCVEGEVKANMEVKKIIPGLKADTSYCVGLKVIKSNINPVWDMAVGKTGVTKKNVEVTMIALGGVSACLVAIVMVVLLCYLCKCSKKRVDKFKGITTPVPRHQDKIIQNSWRHPPSPPPTTSIPSMEGRTNPVIVQMGVDKCQSSNKDSGVVVGNEDHSENARYNMVTLDADNQLLKRQSLMTTTSDESANHGNPGNKENGAPAMTRYPNGSSNPSTGQGNVCINSGQNDAPAVTRYPKSNANPALWHSARLSEHPYDDEDDDEDVSDDEEEEEEDCEGDEDGDKDGDDEEGRIEEDAPPTLEETEDESGRVRLPGVAIELEDLGEGVAENGEVLSLQQSLALFDGAADSNPITSILQAAEGCRLESLSAVPSQPRTDERLESVPAVEAASPMRHTGQHNHNLLCQGHLPLSCFNAERACCSQQLNPVRQCEETLKGLQNVDSDRESDADVHDRPSDLVFDASQTSLGLDSLAPLHENPDGMLEDLEMGQDGGLANDLSNILQAAQGCKLDCLTLSPSDSTDREGKNENCVILVSDNPGAGARAGASRQPHGTDHRLWAATSQSPRLLSAAENNLCVTPVVKSAAQTEPLNDLKLIASGLSSERAVAGQRKNSNEKSLRTSQNGLSLGILPRRDMPHDQNISHGSPEVSPDVSETSFLLTTDGKTSSQQPVSVEEASETSGLLYCKATNKE